MKAPSLYSHVDSKNAIYDAMYAQAWTECREEMTALEARCPPDLRGALQLYARAFFDFSVSDLARFQLMNQRTIPGFEPSRRGLRAGGAGAARSARPHGRARHHRPGGHRPVRRPGRRPGRRPARQRPGRGPVVPTARAGRRHVPRDLGLGAEVAPTPARKALRHDHPDRAAPHEAGPATAPDDRGTTPCAWPPPSTNGSSHSLERLSPEQWRAPTECPGWDVRAMVGHMLGMVQMVASVPEMLRQQLAATRRAKRDGSGLGRRPDGAAGREERPPDHRGAGRGGASARPPRPSGAGGAPPA